MPQASPIVTATPQSPPSGALRVIAILRAFHLFLAHNSDTIASLSRIFTANKNVVVQSFDNALAEANSSTVSCIIPAQGVVRGGTEVIFVGFKVRPGLQVMLAVRQASAAHCSLCSTIVHYLQPV